MELFSPLTPWLLRKAPEPPFKTIDEGTIDRDLGAFIALDHCAGLHEAGALPPQSLEAAWRALRHYVDRACDVVSADEPPILDREETAMIAAALGPPPSQCYPIYLMTAQHAGSAERVVYVGKTSSTVARFNGGHRAIMGLHAPEYEGARKRLYLGCVTLLDKQTDYLPLEAVAPLQTAKRLLTSIELQLIYDLQPALNHQGKRKLLATDPMQITIEKHCEPDNPWKTLIAWPPKTER